MEDGPEIRVAADHEVDPGATPCKPVIHMGGTEHIRSAVAARNAAIETELTNISTKHTRLLKRKTSDGGATTEENKPTDQTNRRLHRHDDILLAVSNQSTEAKQLASAAHERIAHLEEYIKNVTTIRSAEAQHAAGPAEAMQPPRPAGASQSAATGPPQHAHARAPARDAGRSEERTGPRSLARIAT